MEEKEEKLWQWVESVLQYEPISWSRLPELDLYMDQVITLMSKELEPFSLEGERLLTPSMINNYVKDGVLPRPNQKKYGREHLSRLLMICLLKSVLSLPEKARLFQSLPCDGCGEVTAEHLLRLENGKKLCLDCFRAYNRFDV